MGRRPRAEPRGEPVSISTEEPEVHVERLDVERLDVERLDVERLEELVKSRERRRDWWTLLIWAFAAVALFASAIAVGFGMRAIDESNDGGSAPAGGAATAVPQVTLTEFSITPEMISASQSGGLDIVNTGTVEHDFSIQGTDLATPLIAPGETAHLDLSGLDAGSYTVICQVAGHEASGMTAMLHLGAGDEVGGIGAEVGGGTGGGAAMTPEQMDQAMKDSITAFPAATAGLGAQVLAPTVLADGTKQFELTTSMTQWQVAPDRTVEAMTYNGTVPGPTIKVDPGDKVRIVLTNEMPESTSIHFHGLITPNCDGRHDLRHAGSREDGRDVRLRVDGPGHACGRDVPLPPQRGGADPERVGRRVHRRRTACALRCHREPGAGDDPRRLRRHRVRAQRQVVPRDDAVSSQSRASGSSCTT